LHSKVPELSIQEALLPHVLLHSVVDVGIGVGGLVGEGVGAGVLPTNPVPATGDVIQLKIRSDPLS